ncbi:glycine-rich protein, putative [Trichomonas vaginalis G3]|uniref:receptor protein-tyrosine kinase n=1 Tax=Trichomonas vaginalis (strain ATCC PRA-98 / G3) TaxID=412133 RepID=A2G4R4_TRIV3|nr:glycine-rich protein family [Trichomonas vaginalis G3]EAX87858.1 glycine-rich protein, putative [Trichomonas vaginalis G3]KAI5504914.1 glycine-rich protein family [Trichomonas vaginalis G3]|eukprot:XP_001300788.1 glycine-rich protein [Trichomonas vaginalis G3]
MGSNYYESKPYHIELPEGYYLFELWGCSSAFYPQDPVTYPSTNGAYAQGHILLHSNFEFYLHVCHKGEFQMLNYSYGGGGPGQLGGGGATDIRLLPGNYDNYTSLKSRIIVAAGAGASDTSDVGGPGGTIEGFNSKRDYGKGGTQTSGGQGNIDGSFGKGGGNPNRIDVLGNGSGGS